MTAAVLAIGVLADCGEAGDQRAGTVGRPAAHPAHPATPTRQISATLAKRALLAVTDLPTGWTAKPDFAPSATDTSEEYEGCPQYAAVTRKTQAMDDIGAEFTSPAGSDVVEGIEALTEGAARQLLTEFSDAVTACPDIVSRTGDGTPFDLYLKALSFPKLGDDTFAARATATVDGTTVNLDFVMVRHGGVLISISQTVRGVIDTKTTEDVTRRAIAKVESVTS
ncbi:hypothetical protein [Actinoplanes sp. NPDC051411]|uniref:hypothetical protein n=1 Tax=Actinoplanes sp. NPDC051411 TaxID=3155522 RepID=UPI00342EBAE4